MDDQDFPVCEHGVAMDVHCCNCHSGFLFDINQCQCVFDTSVPGPDDIDLQRMDSDHG